jgi:hypothetical protein
VNRVIATAVERGFISERVPVPKLTAKGVKGKARPGFSEDEIKHLLAFMEGWQHEGVKSVEREMRPLLKYSAEQLNTLVNYRSAPPDGQFSVGGNI